MVVYLALAGYTFLAHFTGRHRRCKKLALLLAAASLPAFLALGAPADPAIRPLQSTLQATTLITLILSPLAGLAVLMQKMADEQPHQYTEDIISDGVKNEAPPRNVSTAPRFNNHAAAETVEEEKKIQRRLEKTVPSHASLLPPHFNEKVAGCVSPLTAEQQESSGHKTSREDSLHRIRSQQVAIQAKERRIPRELRVKNLINSGVYDLYLSKLLIKILRNDPRFKDHLDFIRWSDVKILYRIGDKGKKIRLTRRTMMRLTGLRFIEERDGRLFLTERGKKVKMAALKAAIELRKRLLRRKSHDAQ